MNYNIWDKIISNCTTEDIRHFCLIDHLYRDMSLKYFKLYAKLDTDFNQLIYHNLEQIGFDPIIFCDNMYKSQLLMIGLFPLQCIVMESVSNINIHLYTKLSNYSKELDNPFHNYIINHENYNDIYIDKFNSDVKIRVRYNINNINIYILYVDDNLPIIDYINKISYTSLCKTIYTGENIYLSDINTLNKCGYISTYKINNKIDDIDEIKNILEKVAEYFDKKYLINNFNEFINKYKYNDKFKDIFEKYS